MPKDEWNRIHDNLLVCDHWHAYFYQFLFYHGLVFIVLANMSNMFLLQTRKDRKIDLKKEKY